MACDFLRALLIVLLICVIVRMFISVVVNW